ncbi:MAG: ABC transporter substrate-binding protein [Gemmatimonadaceae bacterium]|nr:ABC transporter substrate-binding protein [Acetobacteraceae bacterium]
MAFPTLSRRAFALSTTAALAMPHVARAQAETIKIGVVSPSTGPAAESGKFQLNGARQALEIVNEKGVLGRKMELVIEDDQTTNPGAVLAFSRLASRPDIVAFIGSIRSTQVHAMSPDVLKTGKPMMIGGTDPTLTQQGNKWLFRCRPNDTYSAKVIAEFGTGDLKKQKWAVVFSTDAFGSNGSKALEAALKAKGVTPVLMQGYTNQASDYTAVVLAVRQSGADIVASYFTFEADLGIFARQLRQLGVRIPWVGSPSIVNTTALNLAGPALHGTYGVADYAIDATPESKAFAERYQALYKLVPDNQSSWTYDAVNLLARAIGDAGGTEPEKIRAAMAAIRGFAGAEGEYNFDEKGDGLRGYNVVKNDAGKIVFDRRIEVKD